MKKQTLNEVIVLGTIHSGHFEHKAYSLKVLRDIISEINPDVIFAEIPPDRFHTAMTEWKNNKYILDSRVSQFPEYSEVIIPLSDKMKFEIIPVSAWTEEMSIAREKKLDEIYQDTNRSADVAAYENAVEQSNSILNAAKNEYDPLWINSDKYDEAIGIQMGVFEKVFGKELGIGGWENINKAHFLLIENALNKYANQGKRILITFGAGHKGWLRKALAKSGNIKLLNLFDVI
jgi:hypothetical protein